MSEQPLVSVGDVLDLPNRVYFRGTPGDLHCGHGDLRVRVEDVPSGADAWTGDWLSLTAVEILPDGGDGSVLSLVVHCRVLPGSHPSKPQVVPGLVEW